MRLIGGPRGFGRGVLLAACATVLLGALVPTAAQAQTSVDSDAGSAAVSLYAGNAGTEAPGESVTITITIGNSSAKYVAPGTATVSITEKPLDGRGSLDAWLKPGGDEPATRVIATVPTQGVTAGTNQRVATVTIPEQSVGLSGDSAVYGLQTTVTDASGQVGTGYSSLAYVGTGLQQSIGLAIAMPITVPPTSSGLIASDDLAAYTAADGLLTRQLELARNEPSVAIAIDPMIIASIRVLGTSAPESARNWLNELSLLTNESFPLQYGDADVATQLQSGYTSLLAPTSFGYAIHPGDFSAPLEVGETPEPTPTPTTNNPFVTPTPTATQQPPNVPTIDQLLSWPYTFRGLAWPGDDSLRGSDLEALASNGYPSTIVSGSNTNASSLSSTPNAPLPVKGGTALVTDQGVSTALRAVIAATSPDEENAALASASAQLAEASEQSKGGTIVLAGLDRDWPANAGEATRALNSVLDLPWVGSSSLREALTSPVTSGLQITDATQDAARTASVRSLTDSAGRLDAFSTVLSDPTVLTGDTRNKLMSLLGVGWRQPDNNWPAAVSDFGKQANQTVTSVQITPIGKITVASAQSLIPVTVTNAFDLPVNIVLRATPSNSRLEVDSDTSKTIPAKASAKVLVPVKAKLGNGSVKLGLQLYSPTGLPVGNAQTVSVEVHADWEGLGALILGVAVVLFFGFGLTRSIVRRISGRRKGSRPEGEAGNDAGADENSTPGGPNATKPDPEGDRTPDAGTAEQRTPESDITDADPHGAPRG